MDRVILMGRKPCGAYGPTGRGREILPNMNASIPHDSRRACARMACGSRLCGERRRASPGPTGWQNRTSFGDREQPSSRSGAARDMENTGLRFSVATPSRFGLARNLFGDYIGSGKHSTGCCRIWHSRSRSGRRAQPAWYSSTRKTWGIEVCSGQVTDSSRLVAGYRSSAAILRRKPPPPHRSYDRDHHYGGHADHFRGEVRVVVAFMRLTREERLLIGPQLVVIVK